MSNKSSPAVIGIPGLVIALFHLAACSDVEQRTYLLKASADPAPQTVELWYEKSQPRRWTRAYALRFPRYYYAYEDNHKSLKQTTIGLSMDRQSFDPLAVIVARELGISELSKATNSDRERIVRAMKAAYEPHNNRATVVEITGGGAMRRPSPGNTFYKLFKPAGESAGFALFAHRDQQMAEDPPELEGFSISNPLVLVRCAGGNENCSFSVGYKRSTMSFVLPRSDFEQALPIARQLTGLLESHEVESR